MDPDGFWRREYLRREHLRWEYLRWEYRKEEFAMNIQLMNDTKIAAYFLWEETNYDHPLSLWYCAEDIACFFSRGGILHDKIVLDICAKSVYDDAYIEFVRNVAFRIFIYTNETDADFNWFAAEKLLRNSEWRAAIVNMALAYGTKRDDYIETIRSAQIRDYYLSEGN
jgi:hypothetical protein